MIRFIDLNYYYNREFDDPQVAVKAHKASLGYAEFASGNLDIEVVKHINYEGHIHTNSATYSFFRSRNRFWYIPFRTHRYVKNRHPEIVLVQGFIFPLRVLFLRLKLGRQCVILLQHRGEMPIGKLRIIFQRIADQWIDGYVFTSLGIALGWVKKNIISSSDKCFELPGGSSDFEQQDKPEARRLTGINGDFNFLWVGRLDANKDPLTVLQGFEKYLHVNPNAKLYMIFQSDEMFGRILQFINKYQLLQAAVYMLGKVIHSELPVWYNSADFYISGSQREAGGYALLEAMACGCIPVVTDIPSYRKFTGSGQYGFLFAPGNSDQLFKTLSQLKDINRKKLSDAIIQHFGNTLSHAAIAKQLYDLCCRLTTK